MSTFEHKNSLRTIEAQIVQNFKNNEARPKFTGSYKKKSVYTDFLSTRKRLIKIGMIDWLFDSLFLLRCV